MSLLYGVTFVADDFRESKVWKSAALVYCQSGFLMLLVLLALTSPSEATASKHNASPGWQGSGRPVRLSGTRGSLSSVSNGKHGVSANGKTKVVSANAQLQRLEKNTIKGANDKQGKVGVRQGEKLRISSHRNQKIDFRLKPPHGKGMSNQLGRGSGSKRSGAGRRVNEKMR